MYSEWSNSNLGQQLLRVERAKLEACLPNLHGHYLLQYSAWEQKVIEETTLKYNFVVSNEAKGCAQVDYEQLPLRDSSMDCVCLHHVLEHSDDPRLALREAARVVVPNGYIVLIGFNPWSAWGISRYIPNGRALAQGRYMSKRRVNDWLALLGFRVEQVEMTQYAPPVLTEHFPRFTAKLDRVMANLGVSGGGVYLLVARKLVAGRTPIRPQWRALTGRRLPVASPSARGMRVSSR